MSKMIYLECEVVSPDSPFGFIVIIYLVSNNFINDKN